MDLYEACENGNEERVVELLIHGESRAPLAPRSLRRRTSAAAEPSTRMSSFGLAAGDRLARMPAALRVTASPHEMLTARGTAGRTPLLAACMGGQVGVVRLLLGDACDVYFTSRTRTEAEELLRPLADEYWATAAHDGDPSAHPSASSLFELRMATKDGGADLVPVARVRLPLSRVVPPEDLLDGRTHVDDFGNTPLQCISCFSCGSLARHIDDGLAITRALLRHGDQPNLPKIANRWTPLHWAAYNGNYAQCAMLLDPEAAIAGHHDEHDDIDAPGTTARLALSSSSSTSLPPPSHVRLGKTQFSIPLLVNRDGLFAVDVAGRRGLALLRESNALRELPLADSDYTRWRRRLDHVRVLRVLADEFLAQATHVVAYVQEMNARLPRQLQQPRARAESSPWPSPSSSRAPRLRQRVFTSADAIRYGQHLLYWMGCFGLVDAVKALLALELEVPAHAADEAARATGDSRAFVTVRLRPLYVCSCEENKRQSVLHAVAVHGQREIVRLLLREILHAQQDPLASAAAAASVALAPRKKSMRMPKASAILPSTAAAVPESPRALAAKLEVLPLIDTGWRNYRNETPLFLAVLYLRRDVVAEIHGLLSPASVTWELANCNVEGSFVHHVADDDVRRLLGLEAHRATHAEYVMLFDGLEKRYFKESIIETLREESVLSPSLVVTRGGSKTIPRRLCGLVGARRTDYVVIGATEEVLVRHAQALQLKVKHRGSSIRSKYDATAQHLYEPFRSLQRQQVVHDIIQKSVNLKKHLHKGNLMAIFPLHDASGCRNIMRNWALTDASTRVFQPFAGNSIEQFLVEKRTHQYEMLWPLLTYFGEKHAFFYAFLMFNTVWLLLIAIPGALCQVLWVAGVAPYLAPLFAIVVSIWATLFVERWKRKRSEIQANFGNFKRNRNEEAPEFYGDFAVESPERPTVDVTFPKSIQLLRIYSGIPILLTMAAVAAAIFVGVTLNASASAILAAVFPWMPVLLASYVIPTLNAITMLVLDQLYTRVAVALTQWENHRTVWQFESMLATKLFWFKFLNAFISLFWMAFVERNAAKLRKQLVIIMSARQIWYAIQRNIFPLVQVQHRWRRAGFRRPPLSSSTSSTIPTTSWFTWTEEWYNLELAPPSEAKTDNVPSIVLLQELMYAPDFLMGKQMELVLQYGYITMFISVLPIAPLLALISNVLNTRLDAICCTQVKRRPPFESETEVATFMSILEFMSFAAVAVNCAVLFFTTEDDFESLLGLVGPPWTTGPSRFQMNKLWALLVLEHAVLGLKAMLSLTIDDSATWVQNDEDRRDDEAKRDAQNERARSGLFETANLGDESVNPALDQAMDCQENSKTKTPTPMQTGNAMGQLMAERYATAVRERDEAIQRERRLLRQLHTQPSSPNSTESIAHGKSTTEQVTADATLRVDPSGESSVADNVLGDLFAPESVVVGRRCAICFLLWGVARSEQQLKRCVDCKSFLCRECDEIVHLDDFGIREPAHFRVSVSLDGTEPLMTTTEEAHVLVSAGAGVPCPREAVDAETLRELGDLVTAHLHATAGADVESTARGDVVVRCAQYPTLVLRYLNNAQRRRLYREHPTVKLEPMHPSTPV